MNAPIAQQQGTVVEDFVGCVPGYQTAIVDEDICHGRYFSGTGGSAPNLRRFLSCGVQL